MAKAPHEWKIVVWGTNIKTNKQTEYLITPMLLQYFIMYLFLDLTGTK